MEKKKKFHPTVHLDEEALNIYTDGSCSKGGYGDGGIGVVFLTLNEDGTDWDTEVLPTMGYQNARIGQMELQACIVAMQEVLVRPDMAEYKKIAIYSDSQYVCEEFTRLPFRKRNKWLSSEGAPVENAQLLKELMKLTDSLKPAKVDIGHVKGHKGDKFNKMADRAAKQSRQGHLQPSLEPSRITRKKTSEFTTPKSVEMIGQVLEIRVLETRWMATQRLSKYRIEVLSGNDQGANTFICAGQEVEVLRRNQVCTVRVNEETDNPRIVEVLRDNEPE